MFLNRPFFQSECAYEMGEEQSPCRELYLASHTTVKYSLELKRNKDASISNLVCRDNGRRAYQLKVSLFRRLVTLQLAVDFTTQKNCSPGEIKPQHQDDQGPERSVSRTVGIEKMQIESEAQRDEHP